MLYRIKNRGKNQIKLPKNMQSISFGTTKLDLSNALGNKTTDEIIEILHAIPEDIIALDLSGLELGMRNPAELIQILKAIPSWVTSVNLSKNKLNLFTKDELILILDAFHANLAFLDLELNNLGKKSATDLSGILAILAQRNKLTALSLRANNLCFRKDTFELIFAVKEGLSVLGNITDLNLSNNGLGIIDTSKLVQAITCFSGHLTSLNLGWNGLNQKSNDGNLIEILKAIPRNITSLNLEANCFGGIETNVLISIMKNIPEHIISLSFSQDNLANIYESDMFGGLETIIPAFSDKNDDEMERILGAIPDTLKLLDLSGMNFYKRGVDSLIRIINAIPKGVSALKFGNNHLGLMKNGGGERFISAIPSHITSIDLSDNDFGEMKTNELKRCFAAIPAHVTSIYLGNNKFYKKSNNELNELLGTIPLTVKNVNLKKNKLFKKTDKTDKFFRMLEKNVKEPERFNWGKNGESNFARALAPLISLSTKGMKNTNLEPLAADSVTTILSFLAPSSVQSVRIKQIITEKEQKNELKLSEVAVEPNRVLRNISNFFNNFIPTRNPVSNDVFVNTMASKR